MEKYAESAFTSVGFFWMALWAFALGYLISSLIQVFVTHRKMKQVMGKEGAKSVGLGTFFGFISSSCSFAALASTKSLFQKGAGFVPSMAFLLASTNLVIELGIVISIFLSWQFVVGEYAGGLLLIIFMWIFVKMTRPKKLIKDVRERLERLEASSGDEDGSEAKVSSWQTWKNVSSQYFSEWKMVWKDVTIGFTLAGVISAFVPPSFFNTLFIPLEGLSGINYFLAILEHVVVGPVAAFLTFIGSMGNIPLASVLYSNGVSFAGIMAFIFSDLVVLPVLRINAKYYGWKMSLYILLTLFVALVITTILIHYGFLAAGSLPESHGKSMAEQELFAIDYTFWLNMAFIVITGVMAYLKFFRKGRSYHGHMMADRGKVERLLTFLAIASYIWVAGGLTVKFFILPI